MSLACLPAGPNDQSVNVSLTIFMPGFCVDDLLEALVAVVVGGDAADAAHLDDVALAAERLGQPLGAELAVGDLVVGGHVGLGRVDRLVDGHDHDARARRPP